MAKPRAKFGIRARRERIFSHGARHVRIFLSAQPENEKTKEAIQLGSVSP